MGTIKIIGVGTLKQEKRTKDSKVNRYYFEYKAIDTANPFDGVKDIEFQRHINDGKNTEWSGIDYSEFKPGLTFEGDIVNCNVEPYDINGKSVSTIRVIVRKGQKLEDVLKRKGKKLVSVATTSAQPAKELLG